ncbi:MAG: tRNA (guanosine(46)-N7)-methyltransferase TrmB [Saprospiraceae bacterium]|nr:tRNA (guanosine(46)-N7)-methyltransferase TrmB [Saprospiraceae bacterium]
MSNRSKLEKFADNKKFSNVFENNSYEQPQLFSGFNTIVDYKGKWSKEYFKNNYKLVLELACGRGEYSLGLHNLYSDINIIGVDIKGARIWKGASHSLHEKMNRVAFIRTKIELITNFFGEGEVEEIWITFPDPFPRPGKSNKRLISPFYLGLYEKILKKGSILHLKTDDDNLYNFGIESLQQSPKFTIITQNNDIYSKPLENEALSIKTYYERMHLQNGKTIKYIQAEYLG